MAPSGFPNNMHEFFEQLWKPTFLALLMVSSFIFCAASFVMHHIIHCHAWDGLMGRSGAISLFLISVACLTSSLCTSHRLNPDRRPTMGMGAGRSTGLPDCNVILG